MNKYSLLRLYILYGISSYILIASIHISRHMQCQSEKKGMVGVMGRGLIMALRWWRILLRGGWGILVAVLWDLGANEAFADVAQCPPSLGFDCSLSAFGTVGYAVSDNRSSFLRDIDSSGSLRADTMAGSQLDIRFNPEWSLTLQGVVKQSQDKDTGWTPSLSWAFLSYRPANDWLIRVGKLRPPELVHSQNMEVGFTFDQARLPEEVYYVVSTSYDIIGGAVSKNWTMPDDAEVTLEGHVGMQQGIFYHHYDRASGTNKYNESDSRAIGLTLSRQTAGLLMRAEVQTGSASRRDGDGLYYGDYQAQTLPGPGGGVLYTPADPKHSIRFYHATLGLDWVFHDWRVTSELVYRTVLSSRTSGDLFGGHLSVARKIGDWTPYITVARARSGDATLKLFRDTGNTPVPAAAGAPPLNLPATYHQSLADGVELIDQTSLMIGTSYLVSPNTKLKAEWMHTEVGVGSVLFNGIKPNSGVNIFTVSLSKMF